MSAATPRGRAIVENIRASSEDAAAANPDAVAAVQALARFVESPGQTLVIKLTPRGKVPAMQLFQMLKTDPLVALCAIPDRGFDGAVSYPEPYVLSGRLSRM